MTVSRLGVVGAGTMGAGIAQLGCAAGIATVLHDPLPEALAAGDAGGAQGARERWAEKGRVGAERRRAARPPRRRSTVSPAATS